MADLIATPLDRAPLAFPSVAIVGSSVPTDPESARRYAFRLDERHKADLRRATVAIYRLDIANAMLIDLLTSRGPCSRLSLAVALGEVQMAREALVS